MADKISRAVYPNLRFPRQPLPPHPPAFDLPLEMIPDFRPEQVRRRPLLPSTLERAAPAG